MALAERMLNAEFGDALVDHRTYVLASDGDLMEGLSHEAAAIAGHLRLDRLIVLYDDNGISIDGPTSLADSVDQVKRFQACRWNAEHIDGHDPAAILAALRRAQASDRPSLIACKTTIGFGAPTRAGTAKAHGEALGAEEIAGARKNLHWPYPPFVVPDDILAAWRRAGAAGAGAHQAWRARLAATESARRAEFERRLDGELPPALDAAVKEYKQQARRGFARDRHPQGLGSGARRHRPGRPRTRSPGRPISPARTTTRSPRRRRSRRGIMAAVSSIGACASTPWRRPSTA